MHNRIGHRFQRRLDVPVWLEGKGGLAYANKVKNLAGGPIVYFPHWEESGVVADNYEGIAARDGTYSADVSVGGTAEGIGDGNPAVRFSGAFDVDIDTPSLDAVFDGDEGAVGCWLRLNDIGGWTDGNVRYGIRWLVDGANFIMLRKAAAANTVEWVYSASGTLELVSRAGITTTDWFHMGMVWSRAEDFMQPYFQGAAEGLPQTGIGNWTGTFSDARTGSSGGIGDFWFGWLAHIPLYPVPLSASQMRDLATVREA